MNEGSRFTGGAMPLLFMAAALAAALLLNRLALQGGLEAYFIPSPEQSADTLVEALAAKRYAGARKQFSRDLQSRVSEAELRELMEDVEENRGGILAAEGLDSVEEGERAEARLLVRLGDGSEEVLRFRLVRENWVWKVDSGYGGLVGQR
jgi:hypothetical protein